MSLPEGWVETILGEVCIIKYGKDHKKLSDGHIPCFGSGGIMRYVNDTLYDKPSVLIPRKGTLSNLFYIDKPFWTVDTLFYTIINEERILPKYLFYKLKVKNLAGMNVGSAVPSLTTSALNQLVINIPQTLQEQKAIANILSSFDEKIELLKAQNETLEQMAQGVFRESLNKFDNTNKTTLGQLSKIKYGKDHKHLKDGNFPLYGSGGIMRFVEKSLYDKESILIPRKGTLSNLFFMQEPFWSVDTIFYTEIDESLISPIYLFFKLKQINLVNLNVGSAVPSLTINVLNALELEVPSRNNQEETVQILTSFNKKILYNNSQIQTLQKTRDTLLPKLMSGERRVKGFGV